MDIILNGVSIFPLGFSSLHKNFIIVLPLLSLKAGCALLFIFFVFCVVIFGCCIDSQ